MRWVKISGGDTAGAGLGFFEKIQNFTGNSGTQESKLGHHTKIGAINMGLGKSGKLYFGSLVSWGFWDLYGIGYGGFSENRFFRKKFLKKLNILIFRNIMKK